MNSETGWLIGALLLFGFVIVISTCFRAVSGLKNIFTSLENFRSEVQTLRRELHAMNAERKIPATETPPPLVHQLHPISALEKKQLYGKAGQKP